VSSLGVALAACADDPLGATDLDASAETYDTADTSVDTAIPDVTQDIEDHDASADTVQYDEGDLTPEVAEDTDSSDTPDVELPHFDPGAYPEASTSLFPIGVWSSDPTSDADGALAITLATRYLPEPTGGPIELIVFAPSSNESPDQPTGPLVLRRALEPLDLAVSAFGGEGGFIAFDLRSDDTPLAASTRHAFIFVAGDRRSPIGHFKTPPAATSKPIVRLGATSCASYTFRPFQVLERASEHDLDAFILLGDTTYADDARTLDEYRANWQRNLALAGYRNLRPSTPTIAT